MINTCWRCGFPMALRYTHIATGRELLICANDTCKVPWHMDDPFAIEILDKYSVIAEEVKLAWRELVSRRRGP